MQSQKEEGVPTPSPPKEDVLTSITSTPIREDRRDLKVECDSVFYD